MLIFKQIITMRTQIFFLLGIILLSSTSCGTQYKTIPFGEVSSTFSYAEKKHWAVYAGKAANGEMVSNDDTNVNADVFFVYPTLLTNKRDSRWNAFIDDAVINEDVLKWILPYQAKAWSSSGRLFIPYYRQNHYRAFFEPYINQGGLAAQKLAYNDVKASFLYYLKHENNGRPIILAGHSQGAIHLKKLLQEFFDGTELQQKLVAAYLVGTRVKKEDFNSLKPLTTPSSTGGYVSWNSYKMGKLPKYREWFNGAITTNPVTWDNSKTSEFSQHKGLMFYNEEIFPTSLEVEVIDGLLWVSLPKVPKRFWVSFVKDYHRYDITFFWKDINQNALQRVGAFLNK